MLKSKPLTIIKFSFHDVFFSLTNKQNLKSFIVELLKKHKKNPIEVQYIFCNNDFMLALNKSALNHNYYTDIITFDLSDANGLTAEIYISLDMVRENAILYKETINNELHRVIFHGVLHLCGFNDKSTKDATLMRQMEDKSLKAYFK